MSGLLDFVPEEDRDLVDADTALLIAAVRDSEWLTDDPAGDEDYGRDEQ